jgi:hypothetical protein
MFLISLEWQIILFSLFRRGLLGFFIEFSESIGDKWGLRRDELLVHPLHSLRNHICPAMSLCVSLCPICLCIDSYCKYSIFQEAEVCATEESWSRIFPKPSNIVSNVFLLSSTFKHSSSGNLFSSQTSSWIWEEKIWNANLPLNYIFILGPRFHVCFILPRNLSWVEIELKEAYWTYSNTRYNYQLQWNTVNTTTVRPEYFGNINEVVILTGYFHWEIH